MTDLQLILTVIFAITFPLWVPAILVLGMTALSLVVGVVLAVISFGGIGIYVLVDGIRGFVARACGRSPSP